jgi:hypothetical protein
MSNSKNLAVTAAIGFLAAAGTAYAEQLVIQPRVSAGTQDYSLTFTDVITPSGNGFNFRDGFTIKDRIGYTGAGLTVSGGRFFADLSYQRSRTGESQGDIFQSSATGSGFTNSLGHDHLFDARFDRKEQSGSFGWGVTENLSLLLGYKKATLDMNQARTPSFSPPPISGDVLQIGNYIMDFSYHGFFVGASYSLPVSDKGVFSFQSSVARLNAEFKQRFEGSVFIFNSLTSLVLLNPAFITSSVRGKSSGLNLGVSWTGNFGGAAGSWRRNLGYTVGIDESQYQFDADAVADGDFNEKNTRVRFDLRYSFRTAGQ